VTFEVVIPWRPSCERENGYRAVVENLRSGELTPIVWNGDADPWSPGAARNEGAECVTSAVVVFNDADTIVPVENIMKAIELAAAADGLVYAYDAYYRLGQWASWKHYGDREPCERLPADQTLWSPPSMGCAAISRAAFEQLGGFMEGFEGWGYEDVEFAQRCARLWPIRRIVGPAWHLWHGERREDDSPVESDPEAVARNRELWLASTV
jgi:hypothetical protein